MKPLDRMREFVSSLPDTSERSHFEERMFYVRNKPFGSCDDAGTIVVQLEPEHAAGLVHSDPQLFEPYSRMKHCVRFDLRLVATWKELVRESYELVVAKMSAVTKKPAKKKAAAKKVAAKKTAPKKTTKR